MQAASTSSIGQWPVVCWAAPLLVAIAIVGCATPQVSRPAASNTPVDPAVAEEARKQLEFALRQEMQELGRLTSVFWPLAKAALPLCADRVVGTVGATPSSLLYLREAIRPAVRTLLGMDERLTFTEVIDKSPTALAGVEAGDIITHADGVLLPVSREAGRTYQEALNKALKEKRPVALRTERKGQVREVLMPVEPTCVVAALPITGDQVSAYASARHVWVTRGMLRFASDADLAIVVGHEIAHIALGHTVRNTQPPAGASPPAGDPYRYDPRNPWGQSTPQATPTQPTQASTATPQQRELDADVVGLYLAAAAGLPYKNATNFWRRMAAAYPSTIQGSHTRTHPASPQRFIALERAITRVDEQLGVPGAAQLSLELTTAPLDTAIAILPTKGPVQVRWLSDGYPQRCAAPGIAGVVNKPMPIPAASEALIGAANAGLTKRENQPC
jgi:beta-barrel assembly-enhancing protease